MFSLIKKIAFFFVIIFQVHVYAMAQLKPLSNDIWPFDKELEFPWKAIPGIWYGENEGETVTFSFDVGLSDDGVHQEVNVTQISGRTHSVLATGTIAVGPDNIGSGMMMTRDFSYYYNITVRLAQKKNATGPNDRKFTVVTIEPLLGDLSGLIFHFEMIKTSNHPLRRPCNYVEQSYFCTFSEQKL